MVPMPIKRYATSDFVMRLYSHLAGRRSVWYHLRCMPPLNLVYLWADHPVSWYPNRLQVLTRAWARDWIAIVFNSGPVRSVSAFWILRRLFTYSRLCAHLNTTDSSAKLHVVEINSTARTTFSNELEHASPLNRSQNICAASSVRSIGAEFRGHRTCPTWRQRIRE